MKKLLIVSIFMLTATITALAAEKKIGQQLRELRGIFEQNLEKIDVDFMDNVEKCRNAYGKALINTEEQATKDGDLEGVVEIRKEKKRFSVDRAVDDVVPPNTHKLIKQAVSAYLKSLKNADALRARNSAALARNYVTHLKSLKKKLTTEKRIEDALKVKAAIEAAEKDPMIRQAMASMPVETTRSGPKSCPECNGSRYVVKKCPACKGSGICSYCEGTGMRAGLGGTQNPCFACSGAKKCKKCAGKGEVRELCGKCRGSGVSR